MARPRTPLQTSSTAPGRGAAQMQFQVVERDYLVRVASSDADREAAQRLRFEVFNLELGGGLSSAADSGLDEDAFDAHCDHLLLIHRPTETIVGTYRLQTLAMAERGAGLYCAGEFDLAGFGDRLSEAVELGRACIAREHRLGHALFALWRGLARYAAMASKHLFFGCCSISTLDPRQGLICEAWLARTGRMHPRIRVAPRAGYECVGDPPTAAEIRAFEPPSLFGTYLRYGALACGPPALDREFGTVDFLVIVDSQTLDPRFRRLIFED